MRWNSVSSFGVCEKIADGSVKLVVVVVCQKRQVEIKEVKLKKTAEVEDPSTKKGSLVHKMLISEFDSR